MGNAFNPASGGGVVTVLLDDSTPTSNSTTNLATVGTVAVTPSISKMYIVDIFGTCVGNAVAYSAVQLSDGANVTTSSVVQNSINNGAGIDWHSQFHIIQQSSSVATSVYIGAT